MTLLAILLLVLVLIIFSLLASTLGSFQVLHVAEAAVLPFHASGEGIAIEGTRGTFVGMKPTANAQRLHDASLWLWLFGTFRWFHLPRKGIKPLCVILQDFWCSTSLRAIQCHAL
eukprot:Skav218744  [mRNA]  locus=scaffold1346:995676:998559:- [translate_table: standard]